ncbi:NAD(P)-dependent alcohol dehydrogenase [Sphingomicrobium astaxanthinifaciens]|uniref:NAD(P)-dependent alcohol dehydrogenase n=1 Tax=Sphingomicrobium astaxanthinifaciens TaxID=1227949 RepID=UPI001FCC9BF5|nr:NAD(P)-dependent alcohol dehydrogenase [Sphingomicrobium astaxanthinifaciens]MCJ7420774.1 NAD(P)-dependent alcohol dehydrogenase [Sphingomicrobium astaxanthinifaciens]
MPTQAFGWGVESPDDEIHALRFERRDPRPDDVTIAISHCGICHSDLHFAHDDWGMSNYPMVPGHEIVGTVTAVGPEVTTFAVGDRVGVGCMVDSCLQCEYCTGGQEQFCVEGPTFTYGVPDRNGELTQGGYSDHLLVREEFVCRIPDGLDMAKAAPLLCAGITTYSPLKRWGVRKGTKVAVVGLGGLGHMAVKIALAMGAEVKVVTTSPEKAEAARAMGASDVVVSTDPEAMEAAAASFDLVIDTVPVTHDIDPYVTLLRPNGTMVVVGALEPLPGVSGFNLIFGNRAVAGSAIGGVAETQEMLDFCAEHGIVPEIELIKGEDIASAWSTLEQGDIAHRFVIDVAGSRSG